MGPLMKIGRRNCILLTNLLVISGSLLCTVKSNYKVICIARFLFGAAAGCYSAKRYNFPLTLLSMDIS